jgi:hypothetical protein
MLNTDLILQAAWLINSHKAAHLRVMGRREDVEPQFLQMFLPLDKIWSSALDILDDYCTEDEETIFFTAYMEHAVQRAVQKAPELDQFCHKLRKVRAYVSYN